MRYLQAPIVNANAGQGRLRARHAQLRVRAEDVRWHRVKDQVCLREERVAPDNVGRPARALPDGATAVQAEAELSPTVMNRGRVDRVLNERVLEGAPDEVTR